MSASGKCQLIPSPRKQMRVQWAGERKGHKEPLGVGDCVRYLDCGSTGSFILPRMSVYTDKAS